ncbi:MAG TPA: 5'/3'-nucleotidase SurE [Fimbriiglobus sp.]|jgi:5'-nucleotidase|nr:5'/3'-nucleotidase SurE [Fimbriiglobus sp.]
MKLLLTNDDGIDAAGLQALFDAARTVGDPVIAAPAGPQSGVSHAVTTGTAVRVEASGTHRYTVFGTPADCVRVGLYRLAPDADWVLSGVNHGGNLGADVYYSGTVAAVREAVLHGWPGVAFSQYRKRGVEFDWPGAARQVGRVLRELLDRRPVSGAFYNVNLPHLAPGEPEPEIVYCPLDPRPLPLSYRHEEDGRLYYDGDYHTRDRVPGADVDVCFGGRIAVTLVKLL